MLPSAIGQTQATFDRNTGIFLLAATLLKLNGPGTHHWIVGEEMNEFGVQYGATVKFVTVIVCVILLSMIGYGLTRYRYGVPFIFGMVALPLVTLLVAFWFSIMKYEVVDKYVYVVRPFSKKLVATDIKRVTIDDKAFEGSTRALGNGGLFSITGLFHLPRYGKCRVWVTDMKNVVVIEGAHGCVVLSPKDTKRFIEAIR